MAAVRFTVRLTPRAASDEVVGVAEGMLVVRVAAPPVDDAANRALMRLVARKLGVGPSAVRVAGGARRRQKTLVVDGLSATAVAARWPGLRTGP